MADLDLVTALADAVLFEGYVLYPYRANDAKNAVRWQFGVLMPPGYAQLDPSERTSFRTDVLVEGRAARLTVRVRFLHVRRRTVHGPDGVQVASLDAGDATWLPCDEAELVEADIAVDADEVRHVIDVPGGESAEPLADGAGTLVREWSPVRAEVTVTTDVLPGPYGVRRVRVRVENRTTATRAGTTRPDALRRALVAAHAVIGVEDGRFVSQLDPPEWARGYVAGSENDGVYPVLAGPAGASDLVLASPIILYDHPEVAPESAVAFYDATEMDEMLTLRAMTLTDDEKRQARGSDARAASIVDHVENLPPELMDRLHGAIRSMSAVPRRVDDPDSFDESGSTPWFSAAKDMPWWDPGADASVDPDTDEIVFGGTVLRRGVAVRLRPGTKRADAQDMFLEGRLAHIEAVLNDVDGNTHLAVALDDLVADGVNPHGRFLYFAPEEVEPV